MKTVIEMAREAGAGEPESLYGRTDYVVMTRSELERFTELVRADEREVCAKLVENFAVDIDDEWVLQQAAKAIREGGQT